jgi:predicted nucleic acid-binding protein
MVSAPVLFDTVILIDYLRGIIQARVECDRHADRAISIITWMEVLAGATVANEADARILLLNFQLLPLTPEVAEHAISIRRASKLKLPDAIIKATAEIEGRILITRNTRDFPIGTAGLHIPYTI